MFNLLFSQKRTEPGQQSAINVSWTKHRPLFQTKLKTDVEGLTAMFGMVLNFAAFLHQSLFFWVGASWNNPLTLSGYSNGCYCVWQPCARVCLLLILLTDSKNGFSPLQPHHLAPNGGFIQAAAEVWELKPVLGGGRMKNSLQREHSCFSDRIWQLKKEDFYQRSLHWHKFALRNVTVGLKIIGGKE